jgi:hypothetical protein
VRKLRQNRLPQHAEVIQALLALRTYALLVRSPLSPPRHRVTLRARWVTLRARWVTLRARWVTLTARWVTLRARWVTLRARWVTLRSRWVTLRALSEPKRNGI